MRVRDRPRKRRADQGHCAWRVADVVTRSSRKGKFVDRGYDFGDLAQKLIGARAPSDYSIVVSKMMNSPSASAAQMIGGLCSATWRGSFEESGSRCYGNSNAGIQRTQALVYFGAECVTLLDMRQQFRTDLLVIGLWQSGKLGNRLFERSDHSSNTV